MRALASGLLPLLLTACWNGTGRHGPTAASSAAGTADSVRVSMASCSGAWCSVTLAGRGSRVHVLGTTITFEEIRDGRAALRVGDQTVSCTAGHSVSAGRLRLTCTTVTEDSVSVTAVGR